MRLLFCMLNILLNGKKHYKKAQTFARTSVGGEYKTYFERKTDVGRKSYGSNAMTSEFINGGT